MAQENNLSRGFGVPCAELHVGYAAAVLVPVLLEVHGPLQVPADDVAAFR